MFYFLILSFLSGVTELGAVCFGIIQDYPIYLTVMLPFSYQIGNLLVSLLPKRTSLDVLLAGMAGILSIIYQRYPNLWILAIQFALCSYSIQIGRVRYKSLCPTWLKRSFRIAGFVFSPIMIYRGGQIVFSLTALVCVFIIIKDAITQRENKNIFQRKKVQRTEVSMVMVFHQLHYFVYTYIMPVLVYRMSGSIIISSLVFAVTWIVYLLPQVIVEIFNIRNYRKMFFSCHLFLAVCMANIAIASYFCDTMIILLSWFLTGLGGGSVFCIKHLSRKYGSINMDFSENIGHFAGSLIAVFLCYIDTEHVFIVLPAMSCLFVMITLVLSLYIVNKEHSCNSEIMPIE